MFWDNSILRKQNFEQGIGRVGGDNFASGAAVTDINP